MKKKIVITGASGLIGKSLSQMLGHEYDVWTLGRAQNGQAKHIHWDISKQEIDASKLIGTHAVIHLAGANLADKRWTPSSKKEIISSRVDSLLLLHKAFKSIHQHPETLVSASGVGYYGADTGSDLIDESHKAGDDFISEVCVKWEDASSVFSTEGTRVVKLRLGVVLSSDGGAYSKISGPMRLGFGASFGSGKQYMPWIHLKDALQLFNFSLHRKEMAGPYNACAGAATNGEFTQSLAQSLGKPLWLPPMPAFLLKLGLGEMADILLGGNNISNNKLRELGFEFKFSHLNDAFDDLKK